MKSETQTPEEKKAWLRYLDHSMAELRSTQRDWMAKRKAWLTQSDRLYSDYLRLKPKKPSPIESLRSQGAAGNALADVFEP